MLGSYQIKVSSGMPQKVATAFSATFGSLVGATYTPIAYLGSKQVNGINHAILATQTFTDANDTHSVVLIVMHECPGDVDGTKFQVVSIEPIASDGGKVGGLQINPTWDIPKEAMEVFDKNFQGWMGSKVKPFALLGTQVVNGIKYVFAAETQMIVSPEAMRMGNTAKVVMLSVYSNYAGIQFDTTIIEGTAVGSLETNAAGNLTSPLGEWP